MIDGVVTVCILGAGILWGGYKVGSKLYGEYMTSPSTEPSPIAVPTEYNRFIPYGSYTWNVSEDEVTAQAIRTNGVVHEFGTHRVFYYPIPTEFGLWDAPFKRVESKAW